MADTPRVFEVRLIVIVLVSVTDPAFIDAVREHTNPTSVAGVVPSEIVSNLESVSYVESVIVTQL